LGGLGIGGVPAVGQGADEPTPTASLAPSAVYVERWTNPDVLLLEHPAAVRIITADTIVAARMRFMKVSLRADA